MSEEQLVHSEPMYDLDIRLIGEFFKGLDRQGPGGDRETLRALDVIQSTLPESVMVADMGCGTGRATMLLAERLRGHLKAVDLLSSMLQGLRERFAGSPFADRVDPLQASMEALPFAPQTFDLIWAEGSIYNVGFERGLRLWHDLLRPKGWVAVTECSWLGSKRPTSCRWIEDNFSEIAPIATKIEQMQRCGYHPVAHFTLPSECWVDNYYKPMQQRIPGFLNDHPADRSAQHLVAMLQEEIHCYMRWGDTYGYVFYIGRKV